MNLVAAFECVPAALLGTAVWWLTGKHDPPALLCAGLILLGLDGGLRLRRRAAAGAPWRWLYAGNAGGVVLVFPVWTLGLVQLGVAAARMLGLAV